MLCPRSPLALEVTSLGIQFMWMLFKVAGGSDGQGSRFLSHSRADVFRQAGFQDELYPQSFCGKLFSGLQASDDASGGDNASDCIGGLPNALAISVIVQAQGP